MLCFPIGARQGVLKVTGHEAKRSGRTGMIHNIIESRRDDSVVQDIASTTEASLRDAEGIGPSCPVTPLRSITGYNTARPPDLSLKTSQLNSTALIRLIHPIWLI